MRLGARSRGKQIAVVSVLGAAVVSGCAMSFADESLNGTGILFGTGGGSTSIVDGGRAAPDARGGPVLNALCGTECRATGCFTCNSPDDPLSCVMDAGLPGTGGASVGSGGAGASGHPSTGSGGAGGSLLPDGGRRDATTHGVDAGDASREASLDSGRDASDATPGSDASDGALGPSNPLDSGRGPGDGDPELGANLYCGRRSLVDGSQKSTLIVPVCVPADKCTLGDPYPCTGTSCKCPSGTACTVTVVPGDGGNSVRGTTYCAVPGPGRANEACTSANPCAAGYFCSESRHVCLKMCSTDTVGASACAPGRCQHAEGFPENWGVCVGAVPAAR